MSADHINIQHPDRYGIDSTQYRDRLQIEKLQVELKQLQTWHGCVSNNLEAIFNRIERGETAELHYPDGRVFVITGTERA